MEKKKVTLPCYMVQVDAPKGEGLVKVIEETPSSYLHYHLHGSNRAHTKYGLKAVFRPCTKMELLQAIVEEQL